LNKLFFLKKKIHFEYLNIFSVTKQLPLTLVFLSHNFPWHLRCAKSTWRARTKLFFRKLCKNDRIHFDFWSSARDDDGHCYRCSPA